MRPLFVAALLLSANCSLAQVARYTEALVRNGRIDQAQQLAQQYQHRFGNTPEALAALSWVTRGELSAGKSDKALSDAEEVQRLVIASLAGRKLDSDPFFSMALGAAIEVQAEALAASKRRSEALQLLNTAEHDWQSTSIVSRLRKNILLITLAGHPLPEIQGVPARVWRGKPVLIVFWAHWCADCRADAPVIAKLAREYQSKGLVVLMPTRYYGYTADSENASPAEESRFIDAVYRRYYADIPNAGMPINTSNFERFGASTTPTVVLADARGIVRLYHPGYLDETALRQAIEATINSAITSRR